MEFNVLVRRRRAADDARPPGRDVCRPLRHGDAGSLWRVYLGVAPACVAGDLRWRVRRDARAEAVNQLSSSAATGVVARTRRPWPSDLLALPTVDPGFGLFLWRSPSSSGALLLWCELVVRTVVLTLLLVLVPVIAPALHVSRRCVASAGGSPRPSSPSPSSKFLIVIVLTLGLDELTGRLGDSGHDGGGHAAAGHRDPLRRPADHSRRRAVGVAPARRAAPARDPRRGRRSPSSPAVAAARALVPDARGAGSAGAARRPRLEIWEGDGRPGDAPRRRRRAAGPGRVNPRSRGGHVAYRLDEHGPVVGWHFDE